VELALAQSQKAFVCPDRIGEESSDPVEGIKVFFALGRDVCKIPVEQGSDLIAFFIEQNIVYI